MTKKILIGVVLVFLAAGAIGCRPGQSPGQHPTPAPTEKPVEKPVDHTGKVKVIKKTVPDLVKELLENPDLYAKGTVFQVSGVIILPMYGTPYSDGPRDFYWKFYFGPLVEGKYGVIVKIKEYDREFAGFMRLNNGESVVVQGTYAGFSTSGPWLGAILENPSILR